MRNLLLRLASQQQYDHTDKKQDRTLLTSRQPRIQAEHLHVLTAPKDNLMSRGRDSCILSAASKLAS